MTDLHASIDATASDLVEAHGVVAKLTQATSSPSVAGVLGLDLADAFRGRALAITAGEPIANAAAEYWTAVLTATGVDVVTEGHAAVRIHLSAETAPTRSYPVAVTADKNTGPRLVGEVFGQGVSAAARYLSLVAVGDAVAEALAGPPNEPVDPKL
jgi:hypothetical protein